MERKIMCGTYRMTFLQRQKTDKKQPARARTGTHRGPALLRPAGLAVLLMTLAVWAATGTISPERVNPENAGETEQAQKQSPPSPTGNAIRGPESENWWPQKGNYLVAFISTECSHCQQAVPNLNAYVNVRGLPPLHALCYNEPWQVTLFQKQWGAKFPVHRTTFEMFMQRLGPHRTPCLQWVTNGAVKLTVEPPLPSPEELRRRMQQAGRATPPAPKATGNNRKRA